MRPIVLVFSLLIGFLCTAQETIFINYEVDEVNRVILKNGETIPIERLGNISKNDLKIKVQGAERHSKIKAETVDRIIYNAELGFDTAVSGTFVVNTWRIIKVKNKYVKVIEVIEDDCSIYLDFGHIDPYIIYARRNGEKEYTKIHQLKYPGKKYRKAGAKYFEDCPEVYAMIKKSDIEYKLRYLIPELQEVVGYYNENCGKAKAR